MALDLWPRLHTIKHQDIKLLGLVDHDTGIPASAASATICTCQSQWQPKNKSKQFRRPQKVKEEQYLSEPPIWMQSMMEWMMQSYQQPPTGRQAWVQKDRHTHLAGSGVHA
jgi:hypothetical protein